MPNKDTADAWTRFQSDVQNLAADLRRHYDDTSDTQKSAEISRSLKELGEAADSFFASLDTASRDPEVRQSTRRAARSFGAALQETFREVGSELDRAFRQPTQTK